MRGLKNEHGQALLETALSLTIFLVILIGAAEFGQMAFADIEVANAAQAAAQYATQGPVTAENLTSMLTAARNEYSTPSALTLVSPTASSGYACTCANNGNSVSCSSNSATPCPGSYREMTITVQTQVTYTPSIHLPGLSSSFQLNGSAKRKVLQ